MARLWNVCVGVCWEMGCLRGPTNSSGAPTGPTNVREPMLGPDQSVRGTHRAYKCQGANTWAWPVRLGHKHCLQMSGSQCWDLIRPSGAPKGTTTVREPMLGPIQLILWRDLTRVSPSSIEDGDATSILEHEQPCDWHVSAGNRTRASSPLANSYSNGLLITIVNIYISSRQYVQILHNFCNFINKGVMTKNIQFFSWFVCIIT